ncbi:hypothetical protein FI667_g2780, partial [Globisporangium splendens]
MTASPKHHRPAAASLAATPRDPTLEAVLSSPSRKELLQRSSHRGGAATARRPSTATNEATPHQTSRQRVQVCGDDLGWDASFPFAQVSCCTHVFALLNKDCKRKQPPIAFRAFCGIIQPVSKQAHVVVRTPSHQQQLAKIEHSSSCSSQWRGEHAVGEKDPAVVRPTRFVTETQLYGSGQQNSKTASSALCAAATTLGQEEKRRKHANFVNRLHRIRAQQDEYDALTAPLHDAFDLSQVRRTQTIH